LASIRLGRLGVAVAALLAAACSLPVYRLGIAACPGARTGDPGAVSVRYLGVGGFLLSRCNARDAAGGCLETDSILTAPLYSNPSLIEYLLEHELRTDRDLVDRLLPAEAAAAQAILVGHSHYDHLLDVPYVALEKATRANVYGSSTTRALLASIEPRLAGSGRSIVALDAKAVDPARGQRGEWVGVSKRIRILALRSDHSDQMFLDVLGAKMPLHLGRGPARSALPEGLPRSGSQWAEGPVFAFLIDFLDDSGEPAFRIFYQDAASSAGQGFVPREPALVGSKRVDVTILCGGGEFERLKGQPRAILANTRPRFVIVSHWEDFFVSQASYCVDEKIPGLPATQPSLLGRHLKPSHTDRFVRAVEDALAAEKNPARPWLPCPTASSFDLPREGWSDPPTEATTAFRCPASR
jgi:hypothetical protein